MARKARQAEAVAARGACVGGKKPGGEGALLAVVPAPPRARREAKDGRGLVARDYQPGLTDERAHELGLKALLDGLLLARIRHADVKPVSHALRLPLVSLD